MFFVGIVMMIGKLPYPEILMTFFDVLRASFGEKKLMIGVDSRNKAW